MRTAVEPRWIRRAPTGGAAGVNASARHGKTRRAARSQRGLERRADWRATCTVEPVRPEELRRPPLLELLDMSSRQLGILIVTAETSTSMLVPLERVHRGPLSIGARADIAVDDDALAGEHLYVIVRDGHLFVRAAETSIAPLVVTGEATREVTPSAWVAIDVRSHVLIGHVVVRFSWCEAIAGRPKLPPVRHPPRRSRSSDADADADAIAAAADLTRVAPLTRVGARRPPRTPVRMPYVGAPAHASPLVASTIRERAPARRRARWRWPSRDELFATVRRAVAALSRFVDALEDRGRGARPSPRRALHAK